MCVDCVLASPRIAQVDPGDEPLPEVVLSQLASAKMGFFLIIVMLAIGATQLAHDL
jgi:hypothetical protein